MWSARNCARVGTCAQLRACWHMRACWYMRACTACSRVVTSRRAVTNMKTEGDSTGPGPWGVTSHRGCTSPAWCSAAAGSVPVDVHCCECAHFQCARNCAHVQCARDCAHILKTRHAGDAVGEVTCRGSDAVMGWAMRRLM
jgi:hypothetical protein